MTQQRSPGWVLPFMPVDSVGLISLGQPMAGWRGRMPPARCSICDQDNSGGDLQALHNLLEICPPLFLLSCLAGATGKKISCLCCKWRQF